MEEEKAEEEEREEEEKEKEEKEKVEEEGEEEDMLIRVQKIYIYTVQPTRKKNCFLATAFWLSTESSFQIEMERPAKARYHGHDGLMSCLFI